MFGSAVYSSVKQYIDWKWWCFHIRVSIYKPKFLSDPGPAIVPFHQWLILGPCRIWTFSNAESKKISSTLFQDVICEIEIAQFCGFWSSRKNLPNFPLSVLRHRRYITHFILYMMIQTKQTIHFLKVYHTAVWTRIEMSRDFFVKASLSFFWPNYSHN